MTINQWDSNEKTEDASQPSQHPAITILALNKRSWRDQNPGGVEINLEQTLKEVSEYGHEVVLLTGPDDSQPQEEWDDGVKIKRVRVGRRFSGVLKVILSYLAVTLYFHYYVHRVNPDVVYTVNTPLPWLVLTKRPKVGIFHHIASKTWFETHPFPLSFLGYIFEKIAVIGERNNQTISVSPSTTAELLSHGHKKETICEIRNGLDIGKYAVGERAEDPRILYLGGFQRPKGADRLPKIHRQVEERYDGTVHLDVAGRTGPVRTLVQDYCDKSASATFHGYVSEEEKIRLMQRSWVFLAPSRVEGWGIAVLEANACGTPAVGMNVSGLRDSIRHQETGLLATKDDVDDFTKSVAKLLKDDQQRTIMESKARDWAEQHTWEKAGKRLATVFSNAASKNHS